MYPTGLLKKREPGGRSSGNLFLVLKSVRRTKPVREMRTLCLIY